MTGARWALALALVSLGACRSPSEAPAGEAGEVGEVARVDEQAVVDPAVLRDLLGEAVRVDGDEVRADGLVVRLAFEPLIRQTGPTSLQVVQSQGYRLAGVVEGSPLWLLGLRDGDVIATVDGEPIVGREHELRSIWGARPPNATIGYTRGTETRTLKLRILSGSAWQRTPGLPGVARPPIARPDSPVAEVLVEFEAALRCVEDQADERLGRCELARAAVDKLVGNPEQLARQARIVPATKDGELRGYKLYGIRQSSIPAMFGLQNGDLVAAINGRALGAPDEALAIYEELRDQDKFELTLERRGEPLMLEIAIVDELSGPPAKLLPTLPTRDRGGL